MGKFSVHGFMDYRIIIDDFLVRFQLNVRTHIRIQLEHLFLRSPAFDQISISAENLMFVGNSSSGSSDTKP